MRSKAVSGVVARRWLRKPLACSMAMRLWSAVRSWTVVVWGGGEGALVDQADGGCVGEGLGEAHLGFGQGLGLIAQEQEAAEVLFA